jgi:hypothetical protein
MLGHDDISPNVEMQFNSSTINGIDQPYSSAILVQELLPMKARESEGMSLARSVVSLTCLSVVHFSVLF